MSGTQRGSLEVDEAALPGLSVVIIGRNEGDRLERCILSVQGMLGWSAPELLYVDSGSTDGSPERAQQLGARVLPLPPGMFTAAKARNLGWRQAKGEYVLFLDGDTILNEAFPLYALEELQKDSANAAVWGHRREICPCLSVYVRVMDMDWVFAPGETLYCGGDVLVRRAALQAVDGFDEKLIAGEEPEMCRRMRALGWRIQHIDVPMTLHDLAITRFSQYWRRSQRAGFAYAMVAERFKRTPEPFWSDEVRRNQVRGLFWLLTPIAALGLAVGLRSLWPVALWLLLLLAVAGRTAWLNRWKPATASTLLLYGVHSHLQQVPILFGQFQFWRNRDKALIEYKDVTPVAAAPESRRG